MPLDATSLITTIGGATSNSYVSLQEAANYLDLRLGIDDWQTAEPDDKVRALLMATKSLEKENWLGDRATTTQALAWPRLGVAKRDGVGAGYGSGGGYGGGGYGGWGYGYYGYSAIDLYESTEIPQPVKDAQCELALALLAQGATPGMGSSRVTKFTADGLTVEREYSAVVGSKPDEVLSLLSGLLYGTRLMRA